MKKIYVLLLFLFLSLCVISCSKEDPVIDINKPGSGTVIPTPTPTPEPEPLPTETVSTSFVSYDFEKAEVLACDTASGNYSLRFDGEVPDITSGSVVLVNCDTTNYVVLVTKASTKDKVVDMTGVIGDLSYVFFNTEFTLQTGTTPTTKAYTGRVYYPQEYYTRATWDYTLWSTSVHEENDLYKSAKSRIWTEADFNASLNAILTLEFGSPVKNVIEGIEFLRAGKYTVDACITGGYVSSYDLYMNYSNKGEVNLHPKNNDKYAMLKHNLFPQKSVVFPVGVAPVIPIPVTFSSDLYADVSLSYEGKLDFNMGISASASGTLGLKYDAINNSGLTPYNELSLGYERRDPSLMGYGKVEGKCHIFPRVRACIGGVVGPSLDIKPYAKVSLEGGFKETLGGSSSDYLASSVKTFVGLDAAVGISTTLLNYESWNLSTPDVNIFEAQLFESPVEIEFLDAKKLSDRSYNVSFKVSDRYFDGNNYTSILWPIVNFEAEGTLSSKFVFSEQGIATVNWMPSMRPSKIYARINKPDGSVIDDAEYECEEEDEQLSCPDSHHPHAIDLGLPSGTKWCCMNVGASYPEEYGGYYAWGETIVKSNYKEANYAYFSGQDLDGNGWIDKNFSVQNIGSNIAGTSYDAATANMGGPWRMPSLVQLKELINNCNRQWTQRNGVNGFLITGPSGCQIFLPAANLGGESTNTFYWSSSLTTDDIYAYYLHLYPGSWDLIGMNRSAGISVRPVCP